MVRMLRQLRKPVLTVLKWQLLATLALVLVSALVAGRHGAVSALAGGAISMAAGMVAVLVASLAVSILLGVVGVGFIWWAVRGATSGVPSKRQALVELLIDFVDEQAKGIFHHGDRHRFIAPLALTVFVWVVLMNAMDFLPADLVGLVTHHVSEHGFRYVPTADVNTTFALSLSVLVLTIVFAISA